MKRNNTIIRWCAVLVVAVAAVSVWCLISYNWRRLEDLPTKGQIDQIYQESGEAGVLDSLERYTRSQMRDAWGEPAMGLFGMDGEIWETDRHFVTAYFDDRNRVEGVHVEMRTWTFRAEIIEVGETQLLIEPQEGSTERMSGDRMYVSREPLEEQTDEYVPQVGDVIKITYDGMVQELYPAILPNVFEITVIHE